MSNVCIKIIYTHVESRQTVSPNFILHNGIPMSKPIKFFKLHAQNQYLDKFLIIFSDKIII